MSHPAPPAEPRPGLRERKKARTRQAIQEHALRLFAEQGYARTTVEQIAEAAEVSPSTFFRYFPTKEDVVLYDALDPFIIEAFRRQPADLSPMAAMRAAMHEVWDALPPGTVEEQLERGRLAAEVPELQGRYATEILRTAGMLAGLIGERLGRSPDEFEVRIVAGAMLGATLAALLPYLSGEPVTDFVATVDRAMDIVEDGLRI